MTDPEMIPVCGDLTAEEYARFVDEEGEAVQAKSPREIAAEARGSVQEDAR